MAKKRRKLDEFLSQKRQSADDALEEKTQLSNRLFRLLVGLCLTVLLVFLARPEHLSGYLGTFILVSVVVSLVVCSLQRIRPGIFARPSAFNQLIVLVVLQVLLHQAVLFLNWSPYLIPLPVFAMVATLVFSEGSAIIMCVALAFYMGLFKSTGDIALQPSEVNFQLMLVLGVGSVAAAVTTRPVRTQSKTVRVGLYAGIAQAAAILAWELLGAANSGIVAGDWLQLASTPQFWQQPGWGLAGGVISGAAVTCSLPTIERLFGILTERKLLELSDFSNRLLRLIQDRAPGTFQHTLNVAQLSSAAAEAIDGDALLTRVGAYYHDVGKIVKPDYFVENMGEDKTIHDRLSPSMSKIIIIAHVKDGVDLAREDKLPEKIVDMIPMHHGTTLVEFFFHKAKRDTDPETDTPGENEYRYPGPRPRFREAGILMLADTLEAMAKAESRPNPSRFRVMVHEVILKRLLDGQLDESDLTLNDLRVIEDSFVRSLTTMYHGRIKYPSGDDPPENGTAGKAAAAKSAPPADSAVTAANVEAGSENAEPSSAPAAVPSAKAGPPSAKAGPPSAKAGPPSAKAGPPSAKAGPPSAKAGPPSAKAGPPSSEPSPAAESTEEEAARVTRGF